MEVLAGTPPPSLPSRSLKSQEYKRTGYNAKHRIRANTVSFGLEFKATVATAKNAIYATAKFNREKFGLCGLLLCLLFGVDLRSMYHVDACYSMGRWRKQVLLLSLKCSKILDLPSEIAASTAK